MAQPICGVAYRSGGCGDVDAKPVSKRITYGLRETFSASLEKKVKDYVKILRYTAFYAEQGLAAAPSSLRAFGTLMGHCKNLLSFRDLDTGIPEAVVAINGVYAQRSAQTAKDAMMKTGRCFNAVADGVELTSVFVPLNALLCSAFKRVNVWVTGVCSTVDAIADVEAFFKADLLCEPEQQTLSLLKLAMHVSYVAFAALSILAAPSAFTVVTCLAAGTVFGLTSFFYERLCDPYGKNYQAWHSQAQRVEIAV